MVLAKDVMHLRQVTGLPMMRCKRLLEEHGGDMDAALRATSERSLVPKDKPTGEGTICLYNHMGKIGVMVEVLCQTDFAAKTPDFHRFATAVAMHVAWADPKFVSFDNDAAEDMRTWMSRAPGSPDAEGVPQHAVESRSLDFRTQFCLMDQVEQRESKGTKTIGAMLDELQAKLGEAVKISRFVRWELGEAEA